MEKDKKHFKTFFAIYFIFIGLVYFCNIAYNKIDLLTKQHVYDKAQRGFNDIRKDKKSSALFRMGGRKEFAQKEKEFEKLLKLFKSQNIDRTPPLTIAIMIAGIFVGAAYVIAGCFILAKKTYCLFFTSVS